MSPRLSAGRSRHLIQVIRDGLINASTRSLLNAGVFLALGICLVLLWWAGGTFSYENETLHTATATFVSVACVSLSVVMVSFVGFDRFSAPHYWTSLSLFLFGGLVLVHSIAEEGPVFSALRVYATVVAALFLLPQFFTKALPPKSLLPYSIPFGFLVAACLVALLLIFDPLVEATTVSHGVGEGTADRPHPEASVFARFLDLLSSLVFLAVACRLARGKGNAGRGSDFLLSLALTFLASGMIGHAFTEHWQAAWWGWHAYQIVASVLCFTYMIRLASDSQRDIKQYLKMLQEEIDTRRKEQQEAIAARNEAEEANQSKTNFLMGMSHELRTPLNSILGYSEMISMQVMGPLDNTRYLGYADSIMVSGKHLLHLIDDLIDVTRAETKGLDLEEAQFDLQGLCGKALQMVDTRAQVENVTIAADVDVGSLQIFGDQRRILQAVLNLLVNAIKFSPEGQEVLFQARGNEDGSVSLLVSDHGPGIPDERLDDVRLPFVQVRDSSMIAHEGIGLGLAIVSSIMMLHGGDLYLSNRKYPQSGTIAELRLPMERVVMGAKADIEGPVA